MGLWWGAAFGFSESRMQGWVSQNWQHPWASQGSLGCFGFSFWFCFPFMLISICLSKFGRAFKNYFFPFTLWILFSPFMLLPLSPHLTSFHLLVTTLILALSWSLETEMCFPIEPFFSQITCGGLGWCSWAPWGSVLEHQMSLFRWCLLISHPG